MSLYFWSNTIASALVKNDRVMELLKALNLDVHVIDGKIRGRCPACQGRLAVYVNYGGKLPIGWACEHQCHRKFQPSIVGLAHAALTAADDGEPCSVQDAVTFLRGFIYERPHP